MQQRCVRQHRARYAPADLAPKSKGGHVAAARDRKITGALMPLPLAALAANHEQTVAINQFPECQVIQYTFHTLTILRTMRTIQEQMR